MENEREKSVFREYAEAFITALILALIIRSFVVQAFKIPSGSMLQTLQIGDHILVNKFIYRFTEPKRGDVIVFKYPKDKNRDFIKRVVGLPGETILIKNQKIYINGVVLTEKYIQHAEAISPDGYVFPRDNFGPLKIPADSVFMMGDNRDTSLDSRYWGALKKDLIQGKAFVIYWSIEPYELNPSHVVSSLIGWAKTLSFRIRWGRIGQLVSWLDLSAVPPAYSCTTSTV